MDIVVLNYSQDLTWQELMGFMGCLSSARRKNVLSRDTEDGKINALLTRLLLLSEIEARTGIKQKKISFAKGSFGKPIIKDSALSFSHSSCGHMICAVFNDDDTGVDVQPCDIAIKTETMKRVLCAEELAEVNANGGLSRMLAQKRAFLKRLGLGAECCARSINTLRIPDTAAYERDGMVIGVSGRGAKNAVIAELTEKELLDRYIKLD